MTAISVCLVGKESVIKEGVKSLLAKNNFNVTADYEGISSIKPENKESAQLILSIDEETDTLSGNVQKLKEIYANSRIVVISGNPETSAIMSAFDAGVDGLILKDISCDGLIGSLRLAAAGEKVYPANKMMMPAANSNSNDQAGALDTYNLSKQEMKIINCLANGEPNKVIAHHLNITEATVKVHVRTILRKLGTTNRTKAAILAISHGLTSKQQLAPAQVAQAR
jgi:two-component system nitrate/nitrite response regulator NarL